MTDDDDIREAREAETRRGRRPRDTDAHERRLKLRRDYAQLLWESDERKFRDAIERLGLIEGSAAFDAALAAWREAQKRGRP